MQNVVKLFVDPMKDEDKAGLLAGDKNLDTLAKKGKILSHADQGGVLLHFLMPRSKAETKIETPDPKSTCFGNM